MYVKDCGLVYTCQKTKDFSPPLHSQKIKFSGCDCTLLQDKCSNAGPNQLGRLGNKLKYTD